jgi:SAP domain-containing new25/Domain of unknown function (DUF6434)
MSQQNNEQETLRPDLTRSISIEDFCNYYWLKEELQDFCRQYGISTRGGKIEISKRIERFLMAGFVIQADRANSRLSIPIGRSRPDTSPWVQKSASPERYDTSLGPDTLIPPNFKCTQENRAFFESIIGSQFHFSVYMQDFFKQNVGKTYQDAIDAWYAEEARKKDKSYKKEIAPQFEYNRFTRDFFNDPKNKGKTHQDAIAAWKIKRSRPGDNVYSPDDHYE